MIHLFFLLLSLNAFAGTDIIYGVDDRVDTYACKSSLFKELASKTAAMIHKDNIRVRGKTAELRGKPLGEFFHMCKGQRFYHQPMIAECSGFLVAPNVIASAGHCFQNKFECTQNRWVFNYKVDDARQMNVSVSSDDVYSCNRIIAQKLTRELDFALIELDRPVVGVTPVKFPATPILEGTPVVMIGHPSGLPQKIAANAEVTKVSVTEFQANVDAFQINSGSAVFNAKTGELLGILVRGKQDYRSREGESCNEVNVTDNLDGGEDISSFIQFKHYLNAL